MKIENTSKFPINRASILVKQLSIITAVLMVVLSSLSILFPEVVYPTPTLAEAFLVNDLVNLIIGTPFFLTVFWLINREYFLGWTLLPGALIYVIYNYLAYIFGRSFDQFSLFNLGLVILSAISLGLYIRSVDHQEVKNQLERSVWVRFPGWTLIIFGGGFFLLACYQIVNGLRNGSIPPMGENAVSLADMVVSILWLIGGVGLLKKRAFGYSLGLGLLSVTCTLFIGLISFLLLAPLVVARSFNVSEVLQVLGMSLVGILPTALYWRGVVKRR
jgi:hypothetical protein